MNAGARRIARQPTDRAAGQQSDEVMCEVVNAVEVFERTMGDAYSAAPGSPDPPWLNAVLEVIEQFELASIGLVAWELFLGEEELVPAWRRAMSTGLVERVGRCPYTREPMYRLAEYAVATEDAPATASLAGTGALGAPTPVATRVKRFTAPAPERDESAQPI